MAGVGGRCGDDWHAIVLVQRGWCEWCVLAGGGVLAGRHTGATLCVCARACTRARTRLDDPHTRQCSRRHNGGLATDGPQWTRNHRWLDDDRSWVVCLHERAKFACIIRAHELMPWLQGDRRMRDYPLPPQNHFIPSGS